MLLGPDCFVTVPTRLEVGYHQYATSVYFDDPRAVGCDQCKWLWLSILLHVSLTQSVHILINCIPNVTFARLFLLRVVQALGRELDKAYKVDSFFIVTAQILFLKNYSLGHANLIPCSTYPTDPIFC